MPDEFPKIDRYPTPTRYWRAKSSIPPYDPESIERYELDLRDTNLSDVDASKAYKELMYASFDSQMKWPPDNMMPNNFDWQLIMDLGKR